MRAGRVEVLKIQKFEKLAATPLVTIVTPSYNQGHFIRETIESVLSQDYPRIQYLVVDGESTDDTLHILHDYDGQIEWTSEPDRSQSHAINKGLERARGEIVTWVNSDDLLLPRAVTNVVEAFQRDSTVGAVYGACRIVDRNGATRGFHPASPPDLWALTFLNDFLDQPSVFFRTSAIGEVGEVDESLRYCMDYELFIRLFSRFPVVRIPHALSAFRVYDETITMSGGTPRYREVVRVVRHHTRERMPPATWWYAIEYLAQRAERRTKRIKRDSIRTALLRWNKRSLDTAIRTLIARAHGTFPDNWVGRRCWFAVRKRDGDYLEVTGRTLEKNDREQVLEVRIDGDYVDSIAIPAGKFRLVYPLPDPNRSQVPSGTRAFRAIDQLRRVEIRARWARLLVPRAGLLDVPRDRRKLSWQVKTVRACRLDQLELPGSIGWFDDGWTSPAVTFFLLSSGGTLRLSGRLPEEVGPVLQDQQVRIEIDGCHVREVSFSAGSFEFGLAEPPCGVVFKLQLTANKWVVPRDENLFNDGRRLAFILDRVWSAP